MRHETFSVRMNLPECTQHTTLETTAAPKPLISDVLPEQVRHDLMYYEYDFDAGIDIVGRIAKHALKKGFPDGVDVLNVNIPRNATPDTEIEITRLSRKIFKTAVEKRHDPRGRPYYWIDGDLVQDDNPGTDVHALAQHHISVTPLTLDSTVGLDQLTTREIPETLRGAVEAFY
jgi:broad specificity polyphosphatase/5'/3'-nucleotidase SurE